MATSRSLQRLFQRKKDKELEERKKGFLEEHKENVRKYKIDFSSKIIVVAEGRQAIAIQEMIDATEMLEQENKKVEEANNKENTKDE